MQATGSAEALIHESLPAACPRLDDTAPEASDRQILHIEDARCVRTSAAKQGNDWKNNRACRDMVLDDLAQTHRRADHMLRMLASSESLCHR